MYSDAIKFYKIPDNFFFSPAWFGRVEDFESPSLVISECTMSVGYLCSNPKKKKKKERRLIHSEATP
jgi:hypothetical protein